LARLCALAIVHNGEKAKAKEEEEVVCHSDDRSTTTAVVTRVSFEEGPGGSGSRRGVSVPSPRCGFGPFGGSLRSCQSTRVRTQGESGLKHAVCI
jgi:hypothetical protein